MHTVTIAATGAYLPGAPITNADVERVAGPLPEDILEGIQVKTRHWITDLRTGELTDSNSGMAAKAVQQALARAELDPEEIGLLVVSTASPDYHLPGVATLVQDQLGLRRCAAIDVRSGCAGAVEALDLARMYVERGDHRHAVVVGSEAISPLMVPVFLGRSPERVRMRDRLGVYNFGDGAGAFVLSRDDEAPEGIIGASALACIGGGRAPGMQVVGGATHAPIHRQLEAKRLIELKVDVVEAGRFTPFVLTEGMQDTLARAGVTADAIDACVIPEGNATYMTDELRAAGLLTPEWTALEPKIVENLALVGATGSAAVPLAVDDALVRGRIEPGDVVMLLAIETSKWKFGGLVARWTAPAPAPAKAATAGAAAAPA